MRTAQNAKRITQHSVCFLCLKPDVERRSGFFFIDGKGKAIRIMQYEQRKSCYAFHQILLASSRINHLHETHTTCFFFFLQ
jgi:hypothetical protein